MANRLTDEELRHSLQELGENVGPITGTTRFLWEKRLTSLRKTRRPGSSNLGLNALSSDDSEIEAVESNRVRKKRNSFRSALPVVQLKRLSLNRPLEACLSSPETDVFKRPSPVQIKIPGNEKRNAASSVLRANLDARNKLKKDHPGKFLGTAFDVETSDSDFDSESLPVSMRTLRLRKKNNSAENISDVYRSSKQRKLFPVEDRTNTEIPDGKLSLNSKWSTDANLNHGNFHVGSENSTEDDHKEESYGTNGYLSNAVTNGDFHEEKVQGLSTNYSHCVSWMLVLGTVTFFVIIGALYMTEVQKTTQTANKSYSASKFCSGFKEEQCKSLLVASRELHSLLSTVAGEYECGIGLRIRRNLTISEAKAAVQKKIFKQELSTKSLSKLPDETGFENIFNHIIFLIVKNPDWGIRLYSYSGDKLEHYSDTNVEHYSDIKNLPPDTSALEAIHAAKPFWCRVRHSVQWTTTKLLILVLGGALICLLFFAAKFWKSRREAQEKLFYELIEKVIDILQESPDSSYQSNAISGPYRVVNHVRDMLISPKERKEKQWLWQKVEAFIEENESRVRVEYETISNENCKIWRWLPSSTPETEGGKHGKVWQGQAFSSLGKGKNVCCSSTPCLKIRNMFDPEVEYGTDWQVSIKDAILEKCEGNEGIVHIAVDTSANEGCVYLLCVSSEAAGNAFNALHGWWFDGKLVTVKYLRYERYLERFPTAKHCKEPLKPSNNKRLSLSTPFFSSALERS